MGRVHAKAWQAIAGAQLMGLVDTDPEALSAVGNDMGVPGYRDLDAALRDQDTDVVDVCLPTHLHRATAESLFSAGKHVICEKPLALTLEDARAMMEAAQAAQRKLLVGHVVRFFPVYQQARRLILDRALGQIGTIKTFRGGAYPHGWQDWYGDPQKSGTLATDLLIHDIDFLLWCLGPVTRVYAKSLAEHIDSPADHILASLRFDSGVIAQLEGTWAYPKGFSYGFDIAGAEGLIHFDSAENAPIRTLLRSSSQAGAPVEVPENPVAVSPYQRQLEHFLAVIADNATPLVTAHDGYEALAISLAIRNSIHRGQAITLHSGNEAP